MQQKIVLIGGPGTGKTTVLNKLLEKKYFCMPEISREVILKAKEQGIDQLFLTQPLLFSELLLKGREEQYVTANNQITNLVFFDRGIPDIIAYMDYFKTKYPPIFLEKSKAFLYSKIFHFSPWEAIHITDNERYENFEQTLQIDAFITKTYKKLGYSIIDVPFGSIPDRTNFILNAIDSGV